MLNGFFWSFIHWDEYGMAWRAWLVSGYSFNHIGNLLVLQIHCFPLVSHKVSVMHMRDSISSCELCRRREVFAVLQHSTPPGQGCQTVCRRGKAVCTFGPVLNQIIESNVNFEQRFITKGKDNQQQRLCVLLTNLITLNLFALITFND